MKTTIHVKDRYEAEALSRALDDPEMRAYLLTAGILMELPDDAARSRVLHCAEILLSSAPSARRESRDLRLHDGAAKGNGREAADISE